jgi:Coenzyme PQQ synthesis protein D (PqqD)
MSMTIRTHDHVRSVADADGAVLLDLRRGKYFSLNATGVEIWQKLESGWSVADIDAHLQQTRDLPASACHDVTAFIGQLRRAELIDVGE